jgi:hypothetical protein
MTHPFGIRRIVGRCIPKLWVAHREEAQINRSQGLDGESEDLRPGRPRSFTHHFGMHGLWVLRLLQTCRDEHPR